MSWSVGGIAFTRVISLLTTVALARLLTPKDFGIVALATLALTIVNVFSDVGLTSVLVVRQDLDRRAQGTILTMLLASGAAFSVLLVAVAPVAADVFHEPRVSDVLRALGALSLLSGFYWFYDMLLQRELDFRGRFIAQMARALTYTGVAIALAALGAGVWSLVIGQLAGAVVVSAVLVMLAPYLVRPTFQRSAARAALSEGRGFLLQAGATTLQDNLDFMIVGRVLGAASLGSYSMAYRLGEVPYASIADPIARVNFSAFARRRHAGEDVAPTFLRSLQLVALATWPLGLLLSAAAEPFTLGLLGNRWEAMIGPLGVIGVWAAVRPLETTVGWTLNAMGEARRSGRISTVLLLPLAPAVIAGAQFGGTTGVAWVLLVHLIITVGLLARVAQRRLDISLRRQGRALRPLVAPAIACWGAARATTELTSHAAPALGLLAAVVAGLTAYVAVLLATDIGVLRRAVADVRSVRRSG